MLGQKLVKSHEKFKKNNEKVKRKSVIRLEKIIQKHSNKVENKEMHPLVPIGYSLANVKTVMYNPPVNM